MLWQYKANKDPNKTVHLLKAVQWTRVAWDAVSEEAIQKCQWKSIVIKKPEELRVDEINQQYQREQDELQAQITQLPNIEQALPLNEFIQAAGEVVEDNILATDKEIFNRVVKRYRDD